MSRKKLNKSTFRSFFKNKVGMILLGIIIFITAGVFTLMQSTSQSFSRSYNHEVQTGKLHDFIVNERYSTDGSLGYDVNQIGTPHDGFHINTTDKNAEELSTQFDPGTNKYLPQGYVLLMGNDSPIEVAENRGLPFGVKKVNHIPVLVKWNDIKNLLVDSNANKKVNLINGDIPFELFNYKPRGNNFNSFSDNDQSLLDTFTKQSISVDGQDGIKKIFVSNDFKFKDGIVANTDLLKYTVPGLTAPQNNATVIQTLSTSEIKSKLISVLNAGAATGVLETSATISTSASKSTGTVKQSLQNGLIQPITLTVNDFPVPATGGIENAPEIAAAEKQIKTQIFNNLLTAQSDAFLKQVDNKYANDLDHRKVQSISISSDNGELFKAVNAYDNNQVIDKPVIYSGSSTQDPWTKAIMDAKADAIVNELKKDPTILDIKVNKSKGYKYTIESDKKSIIGVVTPNAPRFVVDPSAYEAVLSPGYAKAHNVTPISDSLWNSESFQTDFNKFVNDVSGPDTNTFYNKYKDHIVKMQSSLFLVKGIGITPDFSYPIIDYNNPVPSSETQGIVTLNRAGYDRTLDAFRTNPTENYLAFRFKDNFTGDKDAIENDIASIAKTDMSWPPNVQILSKYNDTSEKIVMAPQRIAFLQKLDTTIGIISSTVIASLMVLTVLIVMIIIKRNISSQKKTLAILNANGYTKNEIAASFIFPTFLVVGLASIAGYLVGHWMQFAFIHIFTDYWTLPVNQVNFSWLSLIATVAFPIFAVSLFVFLTALWELRHGALKTLSNAESKFGQVISQRAIALFSKFGIKTKLVISFIFTNISKMLTILVATVGSVTAAAISLTSLGKFDYAVNETNKVNDYEYAINLATPTDEGGQYYATIPHDTNKLDDVLTPEIKRSYVGHPDRYKIGFATDDTIHNSKVDGSINKISFIHSPSADDGIAGKDVQGGWANGGVTDAKLEQAINYLNHRVQTRALLDVKLGFAKLGSSNPWDIAKALMPSNQITAANKDFPLFLEKSLEKYKELKAEGKTTLDFTNETWYQDVENVVKYNSDSNDPTAVTNFTNAERSLSEHIVGQTFNSGIVDSFKNFVQLAMYYDIYPFFIAYNQISMNVSDETYSYINFNSDLSNVEGVNSSVNLNIQGINVDSNYVHIGRDLQNKLENYSYSDRGNIPVVINKYVSSYYGLNVGSTINGSVMNTSNRYTLKREAKKQPERKLEVVGIVNSYSGDQVYTLHSIANKVLGLNKTQGFNGVFSDSTAPYALKDVDLYSPSGLYPPFDTIPLNDPNNEYYQLIDTYLKSGANTGALSWLKTATNPVQEFVNIYSKSPFEATISNVDWARMSHFTFQSINNLSSNLIAIAEGLSISIAIIFIVILGTMMVDSNKKNISVLKVLGYRDKEIRNIFIKSFLPSLIIGMLVAIPIVFATLFTMQIAIMSFGAVLIPLSMVGWEIITSAVIVMIAFIIIFVLSIRQLKNESVLNAFKD
ncbi:MAG: ABC transporter permease [Mycoplasma sp.]|nr:ABC transporter permease [Mycoplasma sp.]